MSINLIRTDGVFCPDCFTYTDERTGEYFPGMQNNFDHQCNKIRAGRVRNPVKYPPDEEGGKYLQLSFIKQQLSEKTCERLGGNSRWCSDGSLQINAVVGQRLGSVIDGKICASCGSQMQQILCPTCSGERTIGFKCVSCGGEITK